MSPATSSGGAAVPDDDSLLASLRYLFADIIGDEDEGPPVLPDACPDHLGPAVTEAIDLLIAYQSTSYAQLYIDRLKRFVGRRGVDDAFRKCRDPQRAGTTGRPSRVSRVQFRPPSTG